MLLRAEESSWKLPSPVKISELFGSLKMGCLAKRPSFIPGPWTVLPRDPQARRGFGHLAPMVTAAWKDLQGELLSYR